MQVLVETLTFDVFKILSFHQKLYRLKDEDEYFIENEKYYRLESLFYTSSNIIYNMGTSFLFLEIVIILSIVSLIFYFI